MATTSVRLWDLLPMQATSLLSLGMTRTPPSETGRRLDSPLLTTRKREIVSLVMIADWRDSTFGQGRLQGAIRHSLSISLRRETMTWFSLPVMRRMDYPEPMLLSRMALTTAFL